MIVYRHADPRLPFLWESPDQPPARWHSSGEGPVQYFADTPDGAWAEFLRQEGITSDSELMNVRRALWAVEVPDDLATELPRLPRRVLLGGVGSYPRCQQEARRRRAHGAKALRAPSAALVAGGAGGWKVEGGLRAASKRDGIVLVLFGPHSELVGWRAVFRGSPGPELLERVRPF
jgi:hypothetical protein